MGRLWSWRREYLEWDYVRGVMARWVRIGICSQCGECCRARISFDFEKVGRFTDRKAGGRSADGSGIWQEVRVGSYRHFFRVGRIEAGGGSGCPSLLGDSRCGAYSSRPWICREWPFSPRCIEQMQGCTYTFELVGEQRFMNIIEDGEDGSEIIHIPHLGP